MNFYYMLFLFFLSCLMYSFFYKNILMMLISLEFMMINNFFNMYTYMKIFQLNIFFMILFLSICVCESVIGLSLLINMVHLSGNDYFKNLNLLKY